MVAAVLILTGAVVLFDALLRRGGAYGELESHWPAGWRAIPREKKGDEGPYREGDPVGWTQVVPAGIPPAVSRVSVAAIGFALLWSFAVFLALGDGLAVLRGERTLGFTLASLGLCVTRASVQWALGGAALGNARRHFASSLALALGIDLLLAMVPVPCSDHRSEDVQIAHTGIALDLLVALPFALSAWRRRGLVARDPEALARMN